MTKKPEHVAIIMDGNGRWAQSKFRPRVWGHVRGARIVSNIVETAKNSGLKTLTLYAFSTENWSRPVEEIQALFKLLQKYLLSEAKRIIKNNIRFKVIGTIEGIDAYTQSLISDLERNSAHNNGLTLVFAFNYGGRQEIIDSVNRFIANNPGKKITEEDIKKNCYLPEINNVDLLIRTAGDTRISNFLLWQLCYAELHFTQTKWPDFTAEEFQTILDKFSNTERRFGSLEKDGSLRSAQIFAKQNKSAIDHTLE